MKLLALIVFLLTSLTACASGTPEPGRPKLPYGAWSVGLAAPRYMEVWVERVHVFDRRGHAYFNVFGGVASYTGRPEGWHSGGGKTKPISNVDLPDQISLRWQSLVEPETYRINIKIPRWVHAEMVEPHRIYCEALKEHMTVYRKEITLGMAPGGIVKVWVGGTCLAYKEIGRFQAEVEPLGPHRKGEGIYYSAPTRSAQDYLDKYGIPYGTW